MTVCVAALGDSGQTLILAADRMLTSLAQYQAPDPKVFSLTSSIAVMWSGNDVSFQRIIHNQLLADINTRVKANPDKWLEVEEVANLYLEYFNRARKARMEQSVLKPFGLETDSFLRVVSTLEKGLADRLSGKIASFQVPQISALIVGMDQRGPSPDTTSQAHIYKFDSYGNGVISCEDAIGFAAIGSGDFHALSELMKYGHGPSRLGHETLLATYLAKKRGQAGPGVGEETDFFYFQSRPPFPGYLARVGDDISDTLKNEYKRLTRAESLAALRTRRALEKLLSKRIAPPQPSGQASGKDTATMIEGAATDAKITEGRPPK